MVVFARVSKAKDKGHDTAAAGILRIKGMLGPNSVVSIFFSIIPKQPFINPKPYSSLRLQDELMASILVMRRTYLSKHALCQLEVMDKQSMTKLIGDSSDGAQAID